MSIKGYFAREAEIKTAPETTTEDDTKEFTPEYTDTTTKDDPPPLYRGYEGRKSIWRSDEGFTSTGYEVKSYSPHFHPPTEVITGGPEGWSISAGKRDNCEDNGNDFDIVMNLTGRSIMQTHSIPIPELAKWESGGAKFREMLMDWPDYGVTDLPAQFWIDVVAYLRAKKAKLVVFCVGGHGRTGTAIACFLVTALKWDAEKSIKWVRKNYCKRAIEGAKQEKYIEELSEVING